MRIVKVYPPNYAALRRAFPFIAGRRSILFAWQDTIYNPSGIVVPAHLITHEEVHGVQQKCIGVVTWWDAYIGSTRFRWDEELRAHREELLAFRKTATPAQSDTHRYEMAKRLASPLYGNMVTFEHAMDIL